MGRPTSYVIYRNIFNFILYACDTRLSSTLNKCIDRTQHKHNSVESLINHELGKVIEWLNINRMSLNNNIQIYDFSYS